MQIFINKLLKTGEKTWTFIIKSNQKYPVSIFHKEINVYVIKKIWFDFDKIKYVYVTR